MNVRRKVAAFAATGTLITGIGVFGVMTAGPASADTCTSITYDTFNGQYGACVSPNKEEYVGMYHATSYCPQGDYGTQYYSLETVPPVSDYYTYSGTQCPGLYAGGSYIDLADDYNYR